MPSKAGEHATILVVEDNADFAALIGSVLRAEGHDVATAADGEVALGVVRGLEPDLITLDIQMPRKTGVLFYRHLKSEAAYRDIPVIVVSGLFQQDSVKMNFIRRFFETEKLPPPEGYLEKPLNAGRLIELVNAALQPQSAA